MGTDEELLVGDNSGSWAARNFGGGWGQSITRGDGRAGRITSIAMQVVKCCRGPPRCTLGWGRQQFLRDSVGLRDRLDGVWSGPLANYAKDAAPKRLFDREVILIDTVGKSGSGPGAPFTTQGTMAW